MAETSQQIDIKSCAKIEKPHPCDAVSTCDPTEEEEGDCPSPSICLEKLKNPAFPGEITKCMSGSFINVRACAKVDPPHPCDPLPPCNEKKPELKKNKPCSEPPLCLQRIKNPDNKKENVDSCDPIK